MNKLWLGNIAVNVLNTKEAIQGIMNKLVLKEAADIYFLNDHAYNLAQEDMEYRHILNSCDFLLNDGIGIELGAKMLGFQFKENLNGTDLIPHLLERINKDHQQQVRVFLLGAKPGVAEKARERLQTQYKNVEFVGAMDGYFQTKDTMQIIQEINNKKTDILLVGFGMPLQEQWIHTYRSFLECTLTMAVGGFIDFSSGEATRAPLFFRKLRLEWLYRMIKEPKRLWKRNLVGHFSFFYYILRHKRKARSGVSSS